MFTPNHNSQSGKSPEENKTTPNKIWFMIVCSGKVWNTSTLDGIPTSPTGDRDTLNTFPHIATTGDTLQYGEYKITIINPP